jgi:glycine cleavage system aminomethyltransferase T
LDPVTTLKRTPFHAFHQSAGAKLVDFAGWLMPIQYDGIVAELFACEPDQTTGVAAAMPTSTRFAQ